MVEHAYNESSLRNLVRPHRKLGQGDKKKRRKQMHMECIYIQIVHIFLINFYFKSSQCIDFSSISINIFDSTWP